MSTRQFARGFTLIEVLVALVIVAFGMGALLATVSSAADTTFQLREKSFAEWVALNRIAELRLRAAPPGLGKSSGDVEFAGRTWRWSQEVVDPGIAGIRRIDISVVPADGLGGDSKVADALATATGFIGLAVAASKGLEPDWSLWSISNSAGGAGAPAQPAARPPSPEPDTPVAPPDRTEATP